MKRNAFLWERRELLAPFMNEGDNFLSRYQQELDKLAAAAAAAQQEAQAQKAADEVRVQLMTHCVTCCLVYSRLVPRMSA